MKTVAIDVVITVVIFNLKSLCLLYPVVLVSVGHYNKYHGLGGLNSRHLFLTVSEAGIPTVRVPPSLMPGESPSLACGWLLPGPVLTWPPERSSFSITFDEAASPIHDLITSTCSISSYSHLRD